MKRLLTTLLVAAFAFFGFAATASASTGETDGICVPANAWDEPVEHPAVTTLIEHEAEYRVVEHPAVPAVTNVVPGIWANWSPNDTHGPQDYVPIWPTDSRGTWHVHPQGVPPGHAGPDGVYQRGGGNSPWFYRQAEQVVVVSPGKDAWTETILVKDAWTETRVIKEAWTEWIHHPAVECPDTPIVIDPPVLTPDPEDEGEIIPPDVVESPDEPEPVAVPTTNPQDPELAETGPLDTAIAAATAVAFILGGGTLLALRRRLSVG